MGKTFASFIIGAMLFGSDLLVLVKAVPMNASSTSSSASLSVSTTDGSPHLSTHKEPPGGAQNIASSQYDSQGGFTPSTPYSQEQGKEPTARILQQRRVNTNSNQGNIRKFDSNSLFKNANINSQHQQQYQSSLPTNTLDDPYEFSTPDAIVEDVQVVHHGNPKISYDDILKSIASGSMPTIPTAVENPARINYGNGNHLGHVGQGERKPTSGNYQNFPKNIIAKLQKTGSTHQAKPYIETETHQHAQHVASGPIHHENHAHHVSSGPIHHDHHDHHDHHGHHHHHDSHYHGPIAPVHHTVKSEILHSLPRKNLEAHAHISLGHDHGIGHHHHLTHHGDYYHHGHSIVPAIGKAIKFLLPSALFITGASALFPKRVHVPTNYVHNENGRKKRYAPEDVGPVASERFDSVPSEFLRKEHRAGDDDGIELFSHEDYTDAVDHDQFGGKMPEEVASQESSEERHATIAPGGTEIPAFKPMPIQSSAVPVIKLNKMIPIPKQSQDGGGYDAFNFEDYLDEGKVAEIESQKVAATTGPRQNSKSLNFTPLPQPTAVTKPKLSPQDAMSQLLKITMSASLPTIPTTIASDIKKAKSLTSLVVDQVPVVKPREEILDSQVEPSHDKPIFRPYSTDSPQIFIVTPEPKARLPYEKSDETPDKIVSRRNAASHSTANISSVYIRDGPGPSLILLGGENKETENSVGTEKSDTKSSGNSTTKIEEEDEKEEENIDLSPDSPVVGLITNYAMREKDSPQCQKRALCELAVRGSRSQNATKFERFLWNLANLVPGSLSGYYDLDETFAAIKTKKCKRFRCSNPNLDLQEL